MTILQYPRFLQNHSYPARAALADLYLILFKRSFLKFEIIKGFNSGKSTA